METTKTQSTKQSQITAEPGKLDLWITREFDAPRELVFRAHVDPELFVRWQGPRRLRTEVTRFDATNGGNWAYVSHDTDGSTHAFEGTFHYVSAPTTVIQTFEYLGLPDRGHVILERMDLEELPGGRTRLVGHSVFMTQEDRDGMIASGMEYGVQEGYQRLDELLETL